ncbi:MAG: hypothetical protein GY926_06250, partial [bacterium]|nr:hypothetical protein [bacterium]
AFGRLALAAGRAGLAVARAGLQMIVAAAKATARVVASIAVQIARWVMLGVQALIHAAKVALAWIISLGPLGILIAAVIAAVALIIANWDTVSKFITDTASWIWEKVTAIWTSIVDWISSAIDSIVGFVGSIPGRIVDFLVAIFDLYVAYWTFIIDFVMGIIDSIVEFVGAIPGRIIDFLVAIYDMHVDIYNDVKDFISDAIDSVIDFFSAIPGRVGDAISGITDTITAPFAAAFEGIKSLWNSTVGGFGFSVPSWIPGAGGRSFHIPSMHGGGLFQAPGGADEGLALLQSGEAVIDRTSVRAAARGGTPSSAAPASLQILLGAGDRDLMKWLRRQIRIMGGQVTVTTRA